MLIKLEVQMQLAIVIIAGPICRRSQEFLNGVLDQQGIAKDTHDLCNRPVQFEVVFNDCDQTVGDDSDMYLYFESIFRFSPKGFDTEILLNPFEKQFNLPSIAIKKGNVCFLVEVVDVIGESSSKVRGIEYDTFELNRIVSSVSLACESDCLVSKEVVNSFKHAFTIRDFIIRTKLLTDDEKNSTLLNGVEYVEVKVASIKHIASIPFVDKPQSMDLVSYTFAWMIL
jgi:hypothetical protein